MIFLEVVPWHRMTTVPFQENRLWLFSLYIAVPTAALTLKLIFILYSTPSFRMKACFLKHSKSPVRNEKEKNHRHLYFVHHSDSSAGHRRIQDQTKQNVDIKYLWRKSFLSPFYSLSMECFHVFQTLRIQWQHLSGQSILLDSDLTQITFFWKKTSDIWIWSRQQPPGCWPPCNSQSMKIGSWFAH